MRVLLIHNSYRQPGGEDAVFAAEQELLTEHGCTVATHHVCNASIAGMSKLALASNTLWSRAQYRAIRAKIRAFAPDVAHFHNTLPLISPAGYYAARRAGVPVVQTLHNYRLICPSALLFRDGEVCTECIGRRLPTPAIQHRCYRQSRGATTAVAAMLALHRTLGTFDKCVDRYIALTDFARDRYIEGGIPHDRLVVKPNFLSHDPGVGEGHREGVLFVGRLTHEKGVALLLEAMQLTNADVRLTILGDGPLRRDVQAAAAADSRIVYGGAPANAEVLAQMQRASLLAFPSLWYEGLPMTIVEAYACGTPVLANDMGSMTCLIEPHRTGLLLPPGDARAWAQAISEQQPNRDAWGRAARALFTTRYSAGQNFTRLMDIYESVTPKRRPRPLIESAARQPSW